MEKSSSTRFRRIFALRRNVDRLSAENHALRRLLALRGAAPGGAGAPPSGAYEGPREVRKLAHREGSGKLYAARSRLYRSQILQVNMRLKALVEIYTMHSFAQL